MPNQSRPFAWASLLVAIGQVAGWNVVASGQTHRWHDAGFRFRRTVEAPALTEQQPAQVLVAEFFTHGAVSPSEYEIVVYGNRDLVPLRILQRGPGDLCRVAIQLQKEQSRYFIYYGGTRSETTTLPTWSAEVGLILETRLWKDCDLTRFESVRTAFSTSFPIGASYVDRVFQAYNPHVAQPKPFLSRYSGYLYVPLSGRCAFYTSSQDCSFITINDQLVVAAPGVHRAEPQAKTAGEIELTEGVHRFEYWHAARGEETCMVAAWRLPGFDKPSPISPGAFRSDLVVPATPTRPENREGGFLPDFRMAILGDIPTDDDAPAMVRVQFQDTSNRSAAMGGRIRWDFGDGQSSDQTHPGHVYLHPGPYRVKLSWQQGGSVLDVANVVHVTRHFMADPRESATEDPAAYLKVLESYNAAQLDPIGLIQLVKAYLAGGEHRRAVDAARAALESAASLQTDESRWILINLIAPALRNSLNNPAEAVEVWNLGVRQLRHPPWRFACAIESADLLVNELFTAAAARPLLDGAGRMLAEIPVESRGKFYRVLGDFEARSGQGETARTAYLRAQQSIASRPNTKEAAAWRGAYSRSCEAFLREQELDRAREALDRWQDEFPGDKPDGYWSLLAVRYWLAREQPRKAGFVVQDALAVNRHSPYADRLVFLSAKSAEQDGRLPQALAALQSLISEYPGSPLVEAAKSEIERLEQVQRDEQESATPATKKPAGKKGPVETKKK